MGIVQLKKAQMLNAIRCYRFCTDSLAICELYNIVYTEKNQSYYRIL